MRQLHITKQVTNRSETASLDKYLHEIAKVPLLTADEEAELARRIKNGDDEALDKLTKANLRFVVSVAKQYQNQGVTLSDLINEGNFGLMKAAHRFDETRGFKFISFAVWWIRQAILQAIAEQSRIVRLPMNKVVAISKISKTVAALEQELQREPRISEIAEKLDIPESEVKDSLRNSPRHLSMDASLTKDDDTNLYDVIKSEETAPPDRELIYESLQSELRRVIDLLPEREADVLKLYYGLGSKHPMTLDEIGEKFDLTRERVRQIKEKAIRRLRHDTKCRVLQNYLN
ncbi:MAG: RNA polymerase sigma factor RpoD/SigA [Bacteroidales bacterium]|nr:RNA polymerase sigma factor RpoD/SigA [Bacteroidales bacterium]MBO7586513.1 RNA polymerase sigma factor RpoD/SigA [Bacteroidales bacterium]MBO7648464.1 RNA polymerase sigma factor RpoD/SigA [Bacteroidales bacterium]MBQ4440936.1 RNA polymerase sigma factor RpoD/SigA [Bacteroidales bacterium]MCR4857337.1 RNA polymerase sigma factor RpoD/SigA [Bacteroidales bacterium]